MTESSSGLQSPPAALSRRAARVEEALRSLFPPEAQRTLVERAMAWSLLAGGKRLRPVLALAVAGSVEADEEPLVPAVCGLECLHTYSLIHDDLPAMDDDDLRRGRESCHRRFDEATAILAGDALHTLCFELLLAHPAGEEWAERKVRAASQLARAVGREGMVLGQQLDLASVRDPDPGAELVEMIHSTKTALLLQASCLVGAILGGATAAQEGAFGRFGMALGLAFQVVDDLLDVEGTTEELGKRPGGDVEAGRATAVAAWGVDGARERCIELRREAGDALDELEASGIEAGDLRDLLAYVLDRRR